MFVFVLANTPLCILCRCLIVSEIWLSGLDTFIMYQFSNFLFTYFVLLHNILISFCRKNQQFPNLNPQMVTLAYQRVPVPATLLTQWTLATIISQKHQAVVIVRLISCTAITIAWCFWLYMVARVHWVNSVADTALW